MKLSTLLARLQGVKRGSGGQWTAKCPAHEDGHASLSITERDGKILLYCHAGCSLDEILWTLRLTAGDLYSDMPAKGCRPPHSPPVEGCREAGWLSSSLDGGEGVTTEKRATPSPSVPPLHGRGMGTIHYTYHDALGKPLFRVCRKTGKHFHQERYDRGEWIPGLSGVQTVLYRLPNVLEAVNNGTPIYIVEGEKDADAMEQLGFCATTAPMGAGKWKAQYTDCLKGATVYILPDHDEPGRKHAQQVAAALYGIARSLKVIDLTLLMSNLPPKGDVSDIIDSLGALEATGLLMAMPNCDLVPEWSPPTEEEPPDTPPMDMNPKLVCLDSIPYEEPRFLLAPYLPLGKLTIFQGDAGAGKTAFACGLAAAVSTGAVVCGVPCTQRNVLLVSVEDDAGVLRGRIEKSGGDLSCCSVIDNASSLTLSDDKIETYIRESGAGLVIFDPLQAFLGSKVDMFRANEVRPVLARLSDIAKRTDCAICLICHMSKGQTKAAYRALGSVDFIAATRSALQIGRDPDKTDDCIAVQFKCSNARTGRALRYQIGERGGVSWKGLCDLTTQDLDRAATRKAKGIPYEDEPLVAVIRSLITENPTGVFLSYDEMQSYATQLLGYAPCTDGNAWRDRLQTLTAEAIRNDRVQIAFKRIHAAAFVRFGEIRAPYHTHAVRGVQLSPFVPCQAFQVAMVDNNNAPVTAYTRTQAYTR